MPASGKVAARDAYLQLEDSVGTLRVVDGDLNDSSYTDEAETPESTGYGATYRVYVINGLKTFGFTMSGQFNDTATTGIETVLSGITPGGSTGMVYGPGGSSSGYRKISACLIMTNYEVSAPLADLVQITANFVLRSGSPTYATF